ncbi:MAG: hypothetical protein AAB445_03980 [Patescibacteria group bacterium]
MNKITFNIATPFSGTEVRELLSFAFQVSLVSFLGFYLMESLRPGVVANFFNINIFLWSAIVIGVLSTVWPMVVPEAKVEGKPTWKDYVWMVLLALGTVAVVWYKTSSIGWLVKVIAPLSGLIVLGLSLLVYFDKDES